MSQHQEINHQRDTNYLTGITQVHILHESKAYPQMNPQTPREGYSDSPPHIHLDKCIQLLHQNHLNLNGRYHCFQI